MNYDILIAEDTEFSKLMIEHVFSVTNHNITFVDNGKKAVDTVKTGKNFDIILLDIEMPVLDGNEAMLQIKELLSNSDKITFVLALTAHNNQENLDEMVRAGFDGYLSKPFEIQRFDAIIENLLNNKSGENKSGGDNYEEDINIFDNKILQQWAMGDEVFALNMLTIYLEEAPVYLRQMQNYLNTQNWNLLKEMVHKFNSQVAFIGVNVVEELSQIEALSKSNKNEAAISKLLPLVIQKVNKSFGIIKETYNID